MVGTPKRPHRVETHPPRGGGRGDGDGLRCDIGGVVRHWARTRIHLRRDLLRYRRRAGSRRVRADPAPVRRLLGGRRADVGGRGVRRGRGGRTAGAGFASGDVRPLALARHQPLFCDARGGATRDGADPAAGPGGDAQGQGVDRSDRHVLRRGPARRGGPAVASAGTVGALAVLRAAGQDAACLGART